MKLILQIWFLAACAAIAVAKYKSEDFTEEGIYVAIKKIVLPYSLLQ